MRNNFYYFPPWRKQFNFSARLVDNSNIELMYYPYTALSRVVWKLWKSIKLFRSCFMIKPNELPSPFDRIIFMFQLQEATFQVNRGTIGPEQKMTMIAFKPTGETIFIKAGESEVARQLIDNEIETLSRLNGVLGVPRIVGHYSDDGLRIIATETIKGRKMTRTKLDPAVFNYILKISSLQISCKTDALITTFAHGDCCPWNFLECSNTECVLIDWEMAGIYPLGYDLFTYIFQTEFLLSRQIVVKDIILKNWEWIEQYFNNFEIDNYKPYLLAFVKSKLDKTQKTSISYAKWRLLLDYIEKL